MSTENIQERAEAEYPRLAHDYFSSIKRNAYIKGATEERELMSNQWVSVETPPEHGTRVLLRHDYGNGVEYSTDLWCDEVIKFLSLNCITHYQVIHPLLPVIKKG